MTETYVPDLGRYDDTPSDEYHERWLAMNASGLKSFGKTPAHYHYALTHPSFETDAMRLGTATHACVLEPELFEREYTLDPTKPDSPVAYPPGWRNTKAYKAAKADLIERGYKVLSQKEFDACRGMRDKLYRERGDAYDVLQAITATEVSFALDHSATGMRCKIRIDALAPGIQVDLKTTESLAKFRRDLFNLHYDWGAVFYSDLMKDNYPGVADTHIFLVVEKDPPFEFALLQVDDDSLDLAREKVESMMMVAKQCKDSGEYPGYSRKLEYIRSPRWAFTEE